MSPAAQPDTEGATLIRRLQESRDRYLRAVGSANDPSLRLGPDSWSILECAEHVAVAERQMLALWTKLSLPGQANPVQDQTVPQRAVDRTQKLTAPDRSRPTGRYATLAEAIKDFNASRAQTIIYVESNAAALRGKTITHPLMGVLDGYQLMLLMAGHAERHAAQIDEIKNQAGKTATL